MVGQLEGDPEAKKLIQRNSKRLLRLVNQLLDMSKLESGKMKLALIQRDIISFLRYLVESYQSYAKSKQVELKFQSSVKVLVMNFDPEKLQQIFANLISNAFKFTAEGDQIIIACTTSSSGFWKVPKNLIITIEDNGQGIKAAALPLIFDRFYQADNSPLSGGQGTGIGLALTRELVNLMKGHISATSQWGKGTTFTVTLPVHTGELAAEITARPVPTMEPPTPASTTFPDEKNDTKPGPPKATLPVLLIIEDNLDVITYIKTCLQGNYQLHTAHDGKEGIDKALEIIPDIIISDVMMPYKDGFEVTKTLKSDERTSHVPIILLTARADVESKIEGLKRGADAYLAKPFHKQELLVRLQKLVELRKRMQSRYSSLSPNAPTTDPSLQIEDAFLKKLQSSVEANLDDHLFGVNDLCKEIGMSQPQLYRKIKALTNKSPSAYLRTIRLQKSKALLKDPNLTVSEVAYKVGFSDPSYFSKTFSEAFGYPPSEKRDSQ